MAKEKQSLMVNTPMIDPDPKRVGNSVSDFENDLIIFYL